MASPIPPPTSIPNQSHKTPSSASAICSSFAKKVCLSKWWLIKAETDSSCKGLGVGGFAFRDGQGIRVFRSESISKRHDTDTIETVDGITINLIGFIDQPRTCKNGFPSKVCNLFHFGFPYDWEEYAARYCGDESNKDDIPSGVSSLGGTSNSQLNLNNPLPTSFDDIPVAQVRDLLLSPSEDSEYRAISRIIFNDILRKCGDNSSKESGPNIRSNDESKGKTSNDHHSIKDDNCISDTTLTRKKQLDKTGLRSGVATRSMRKRESEKILSSTSSATECGLGEPFCEPEACTIAETGASNESNAAAADLSEEMGIKGTPTKSGVKIYSWGKDFGKFSEPSVVIGKKKSGGKNYSNECDTEETKVVEKLFESPVRRSKRLKNLSKCGLWW